MANGDQIIPKGDILRTDKEINGAGNGEDKNSASFSTFCTVFCGCVILKQGRSVNMERVEN